jgi:peroxiredoxin
MRWLREILSGTAGEKNMAALTTGTKAPDFELKTTDGNPFLLRDELARGPVVLAFFKVSCPVCQYAFPYLERLHQAYKQKGYTLVGISQNDSKATSAFMREFGVTFPVLLDDPRTYPASNAYGLTNVPTVFWIAADGTIEVSSVGWVRKDFEEIAHRMASSGNLPAAPIFKPGEEVRDFRAG